MDALTQRQLAARLASLPPQWVAGFPLSLDEHGVAGRFFKCALHSRFVPVAVGVGSLLRGELDARSPEGEAFPADKLFRLAAGEDGLLKLDRLCRLIHALNHFIVAGRHEPLILPIHPRLFDYVRVAHGRTFSRLLAHFELTPSRVLLEVPSSLPQAVIDNYLGQGFAVRPAV